MADAPAGVCEDGADLIEASRSFGNGLIRISQQQEMGVAEVPRGYDELGCCVVLHLVDHGEAHLLGSQARDAHLEIDPFQGREAATPQQAEPEVVDVYPGVLFEQGIGGSEPATDELSCSGDRLLFGQ